MDKTLVKIPEKFASHPIFNSLICGTNFGFMAKRGYYAQPEVLKQPELMKKAGINWTTLNMNFCQTNFYSDKVFLDFEFSTGELEMSEIVKRLHDNGIKILFKPCLTSLDGSWMGLVKFPDLGGSQQIAGIERNDYWGRWFRSFTESSKYFSDLAERLGIDAMIIGAEYFGTEGQNEYWEKVIEEVRQRFSGPITYEFTPASRKEHDLKWFKKLDFLAYSYYPPAAPANEEPLDAARNDKAAQSPSYTVEQMADYLSSRKEKIASISKSFDNMPIAFTEYGTRSAHGCVMQPFNFLWDTYYDGEEQANYMEASFRTFWEVPQWMGFFWWKWDETQYRPHYHTEPGVDKGFTIQGKPAEGVMRRWLEKAGRFNGKA